MNIILDEGAIMPTRAHDTDAGIDLYSRIQQIIPAHGSAIFNTGVHVELPKNTAGFIKSKSGLNIKYGITSEGVIDVGYKVMQGDKITQLVIVNIVTPELTLVDNFEKTERGDNGFGSTGK